MAAARTVSSPADLPPACGFTFDDVRCTRRGEHLCQPRALKIVGFFEEILVHTKGRWARQPFRLEDWQRDDIAVPLFGTVVWSQESQRYVRRYRIAWIEIARKNGKALAVDTPILAGRGWITMGELRPGDTVHAPDGSLTDVQWVSDRHVRPSFRVRFADGAEIVAADDHKWLVNDRRLGGSRVATTAEMAASLTYGKRQDRRYSVDVPEAVDRPDVDLPVDPYVFGAWLGDGTAARAEITTPDAEIVAAFEAAGYPATYCYQRGIAQTRGFRGLQPVLRAMGVLGNKHIPAAYATASQRQRLALLQGLMDSDGSVNVGRSTPRVEFMSCNQGLAVGVLELARSLGWKATIREGRATLNGVDHGPKWRVCFTAWRDRPPFRLARHIERLAEAGGRTRSHTNAVVAVEPVGEREVVCIAVEHPTHVFLAGRSLTPTHNSEILAGFALYLLIADDEQGAEIYGCAADRDQARKVYDVAERMVQLSPLLSRRLKVYKAAKRIVDERTASYYEIIAADAAGALGHNPSGVAFDEILSQKNGDLWAAMRTAMGARTQPLMIAATTAGNDPNSFGKSEHDEMARIAADPDRARHIFTYIRSLPSDADPWDENNWKIPNPALGSFLSLEALRDEALEARNDPTKENFFRQFRQNQWVSQSSRWMPMHLWDECAGDVYLHPSTGATRLGGVTAFAGFDLAAKFDLTAWCLLLPEGGQDDPVHLLWRFWLPESGLDKLDELHEGRFTRWAREGWLTVTEGSVIDYDRVVDDVTEDARNFRIVGADCDEWSMWPVINRIADACALDVDQGEITAYRNTYDRMSPGMDILMGLVRTGRLRHHGNPLARFCFDMVEVRHAAYDPNLIRPVKPERLRDRARIDAVPAAAMACNSWTVRAAEQNYTSAYESRGLMVI